MSGTDRRQDRLFAEVCAPCGFDPADYLLASDVSWLRRAAPERLCLALESLGENGAARRGSLLASLDELLAGGALHEAVHLVSDVAGEARAATAGRLVLVRGRVQQVNVSNGGVPKSPLPEAEVTRRGIVGDRQHDVRHHGHPWQALCLFSAERIDALAAEGHPISYGSTGENLTLSGIDWSELTTGWRLLIGEVECELTGPTVPCSKNAQFFLNGDFRRMSYDRHPGWSRWYASVRRPGRVAVGDAVLASRATSAGELAFSAD